MEPRFIEIACAFVFLTGSVLHEDMNVLRKAGAKSIEVFTLAQAAYNVKAIPEKLYFTGEEVLFD